MAIYVKGHLRGKSLVKAYKRQGARIDRAMKSLSSTHPSALARARVASAAEVRKQAMFWLEQKYNLSRGKSPRRTSLFSNTGLARKLKYG